MHSINFNSVGGGGENEVKAADLATIFEGTMKNMTERIDKKIKFSPLATPPEGVAVVDGPFVFHCSPTPNDQNYTDNKEWAPKCPPGVYIMNNTAYHYNEELAVPRSINNITN